MSASRYAFRHGVRFQGETGKYFIVSKFPLKAVRISPELRPMFERIAASGDASLKELCMLVPKGHAGGLEQFLNRLVDRGFLEESGRGPHDANMERARVSVVIPVYNRPEAIAECLTSLSRTDASDATVETIVVDDGSTDLTAATASQFDVKCLHTGGRRGASFCRNLGAAKAAGDILVFLDSDCTVAEGWLRELLTAFEEPGVTACGGMVDSREDRKALDRYEQAKSSLMMGYRRRDSRDEGPFFYLPSCNLAVRRDRFMGGGGFREDLSVGEDVDLCWRLADKGGVIVYRPSAVVYHRHRNVVTSFCARRFDYGTSEPLLQQLHLSRRKKLILRPRPFAFWMLFILGLGLPHMWPMIAALAILVADALWHRRQAQRSGLQLSFRQMLAAKGRAYAGFFYHVCAFGSRYYLLPAVMAGWLWPEAALAVAGGHLLAGLVQYAVHRPRLNPFAFLFYFTLEQVSYQAGVWWGCLKALFWAPVLPRLCFGTSGNE